MKKENIKINKHIEEKVSLRRRIEVLEETQYKLKEEISPLIKEIEKIKDWIGMGN